MPHHFTKATVMATVWCDVCGKPTVHHVFDGRRGGCQECIARRDAEHVQREAEKLSPAAVQERLF
jgi:hypothetical protein